ncbi:MAG: hypothetical protein KIT43_09205 [Bauldia sp.]|nr:hypothetical protein [Bauldia sp.]
MSDTPNKRTDQHGPGTYEVRIAGHLGQRWAERFGVPSLAHDDDGTTVIRRVFADQAALHGLLQTVRDLGLPLVSVTRIGIEQQT